MAAPIPYRTVLPESAIPRQWYNIRADMPNPAAPLLNPGTGQPMTLEEMSVVFCTELAQQELDDKTRYIDIPQEIYDCYKVYRPSPLMRAYCLERDLGTPARVYYKFEGNNTSGSHKLNSAIAQVYYAKKQGIKSLTTETGAGQWGSALAMGCAFFKIPLTVYMVKGSYNQKPFRKAIIETFGAKIVASPSDTTKAGRGFLAKDPDSPGSLGCAISEAVEASVTAPNHDCRYVLGSVLTQVLIHQTVIGLEAKAAFDLIGDYPDIIVGCAGGGSNLGGLMAPFMQQKILGEKNPYFIAAEPASCPSLTRGKFAYDFCDMGRTTPLAKMYTLGCEFVPYPTHAGGLRYHGMSPVLSQLYHDKLLDEARAVVQTEIFESAVRFAKSEGILPAPESSHAIHFGIEEALKCKDTGEAKTILIGLSGTGYFDMNAYSQYLDHTMADRIPTDEELERGFASLPKIPGIQE
jgi:tryptophan synthase beta chain